MGWSVHFSGGIPTWLALVIALVALAVTVLSYMLARRAASRGHIAFLTGLRVFGITLVLIIALRPLVTYRTSEGRRGRYLLLVDTSRSMALRDYPNLPSRLDRTKAQLAREAPHMRVLAKAFRLELHAFDEALKGETALAQLDSLSAGGEASAVVDALNALASKGAARETTGVMLFSDGIDTSPGGDYSGTLPVIAVGVGTRLAAEGEFRDVILSNVEVLPAGEPVVSKGNLAMVAAYVEGLGCGGLVVPVRLLDSSGAAIAEQLVTLDAMRGDQKVVLSFTPEKKGNFKYTLEVAHQPREMILENNSRNLNITVTDPEIRVLYFEGTLRAEYRYLKRTLEKDPNLRFLALVRLSERTFYQQGNTTDIELNGFPQDAETLKKFNVIMIGDVDASGFSARDMANMKEAVFEGAGLVMLGGYSSFSAGYRQTALADVLPVEIELESAGQDRNEFVPQLTDLGEVSPVFAGITEHFRGPGRRAAHEVPPLLGQVKLGRPKPGATLLAVNPLRSDQRGPLSVLVVQNFGAGRTAAFAGDTTWRWYAPLRGLGLESPYVRFWGQLIRWLARREELEESGEPGVEAWVDKAFYALGDTVAVTAKVRGADGLLTDKAPVEARVSGPDELGIPLAAVAGAKGTYGAQFEPGKPGTYSVTVSARLEGALLGEAPLAFEVGSEDIEMRRLDLDEDNLRRLATESGGAYVPLVEFPSYAAGLRDLGATEKTVEFLNLRQKKVLYPLFFVFIALVTVEWFWRKRLQMP